MCLKKNMCASGNWKNSFIFFISSVLCWIDKNGNGREREFQISYFKLKGIQACMIEPVI